MQRSLKDSWKFFLPKGYVPWSVKSDSLSPELGKIYFIYLDEEKAAQIAAEKMQKALLADIPTDSNLQILSWSQFQLLPEGVRKNNRAICLFEQTAEMGTEQAFFSGAFGEIEKSPQKKKEFWSALKNWVSTH